MGKSIEIKKVITLDHFSKVNVIRGEFGNAPRELHRWWIFFEEKVTEYV